MLKKFRTLSTYKQHILSILFSTACMGTAALGSSLYYMRSANAVNVTLIFLFFLILVSCAVVTYLYDILCSLFAVLLLCNLYRTSPFECLLTFLGMSAVTLLISRLIFRQIIQTDLSAEHEKRLLQTNSDRIRANLLRAVSHDLRTPLASIMGNSLILLENENNLNSDEKNRIISYIHEDSSWLSNMTENLLAVARIRDDDFAITSRDEIVEEVVGEALQKMERRHPGCIIQVRIPDDIIMLSMDAILIEQVIINLLENALQHSSSDKPVNLLVESTSREAVFTIRDYGQGIPEEMLDTLFDGAACTIAHTADSRKGNGIGLAICKTIIDAHHGSIVGRNHDKGAEFIFTLPQNEKSRDPVSSCP